MTKKLSKNDLQDLITQKNRELRGLAVDLENETEERKQWEIEKAIETLEAEIEEAEGDLIVLEEKEEQTQSAKFWAKNKQRIASIIEKYNMGYLPSRNKIIWCQDASPSNEKNIVNPQFEEMPVTPKSVTDNFKNLHKKEFGNVNVAGISEERVRDLFIDMDRAYINTTSTFRTNKWDTNYYNKMDILRQFWVQPEEGEYNKAFDFMVDLIPSARHGNYDKRWAFLFHCACGEKEENVEHMQKLIWHKHQHPENAANTPSLDLGGGRGGTGKGAIITLLKYMLTSSCVIAASPKELKDFNGAWENAVYVYFDEGNQLELSIDDLKKNTGNEDRRSEAKFENARMVDNNHTFMFTTNREEGVVKLTGKGRSSEDRRWSVIKTETPMIAEAQRLFGFTEEEATEFVDSIWVDCIRNRQQIAIFLKHLQVTYGDIQHLPALHGEDYRDRFNTQKDDLTRAFDAILPVLKDQGVMATDWIHRIAQTRTENPGRKHKNVIAEFERYLTDQGVKFTIKDHTKINIGADNTVTLKAVRLTGDAEKTPYAFNWSLLSKASYDKYKASFDKDNYGLDILKDEPENVIQLGSASEMLKKYKKVND